MIQRNMVIEMVDDDMAMVLRHKTGAERLHIVDSLYHAAWNLIESNVRSRNSGWTPQQIRRAVAERIARGTD
jgi:hypothetical protein